MRTSYFDGGKTYKVTLPANIPAANFWSFTVYDNQTRSMLQTPQRSPRAGSQTYPMPAAVANADGSTTVYFGPSKPAEAKEGTWIQTTPGKGWFTILRLYARWSRSSRRHGVRPRSSSSNERPGADKDKPIVGLIVIRDLGPSGDRWKGGSILDPDDGMVYKTELWVEEGKLKVRGYVGALLQNPDVVEVVADRCNEGRATHEALR